MNRLQVHHANFPDDAPAIRTENVTVFIQEQDITAAQEWDEADRHAQQVLRGFYLRHGFYAH